MESLQCIDFNIFAEIITDMHKKMLFLWVCESGQERPARPCGSTENISGPALRCTKKVGQREKE